MSNHPGASLGQAPVTRSNVVACKRCRRKKKRCDQKLPRCRLCEIADAECIGYDAVSRREVPRSYVVSLETRVAELERGQPSQGCDAASLGHGQYHAASSTTFSRQQNRDNDAHCLPARLNIDATVLDTVVGSRPDLQSHDVQARTLDELAEQAIALPTRDAAEVLIKAYIDFANLSQPVLFEPHLREQVQLLYKMPLRIDLVNTHTDPQSQTACFFVLGAFAVALIVLKKQDPSKVPMSLADRYHRGSLTAFRARNFPDSVESIQALLLLAQYTYHHRTMWSSWRTVGAALRLAAQLGLHRDAVEDDSDRAHADIRRRVFWTAYAMDRNISTALDLPSGLPDSSITAQFPSELDDTALQSNLISSASVSVSAKSICTHVFQWRRMQSEMHDVLFSGPPPGYAAVDIDSWQVKMRQKIESWYNSTPRSSNFSNQDRTVVDNFDLTYRRALFYLYHESPNRQQPDSSAVVQAADAVVQMIPLYKQFFDERRLTIYWQAISNLSTAGTALIRAYVREPLVRERVTLGQLQTLTQTCSSVLWGMVEHFPAFKSKRDSYDQYSTGVLSLLMTAHGSSPSPDQSWFNSINVEVAGSSVGRHQQAIQPYSASSVYLDNAGAFPSYEDFEMAAFDWDTIENAEVTFTSSWF